MGNWNINIQGIGCHHNGKPEIDADLMAADFVGFLRRKGHTIETASFTSGGKVDLVEASKPRATVKATLNGVEVVLPGVVSYDDIRQALGWSASNPSITYVRAAGGAEGILTEGRSIEIQDGTRLNVANTSRA